jgi:hypothetical protein
MSLCLIAIFKNESHIINEWIDHYRKEGVDQFFLIDNGSTDTYTIPYSNVEVVKDDTKHAQDKLYNKYYLEKCKKYKWAIVCDLDEFIYARKHNTIKECLHYLHPSISQVFIPWKIFGSNGLIQQPSNVVKYFTKRINYDKSENFQGVIQENNKKYSFVKCIVKTKDLLKLNIHSHKTKNQAFSSSDGKNNITKGSFSEINETILKESLLHLNHYAIQSFEWCKNVKLTRGSAASERSSIRKSDIQYFYDFDKCSNDISDEELKNKGLMRSNIKGK